MTRKDKYFGDNYNLNPELFNNLIKHAQAAKGKVHLQRTIIHLQRVIRISTIRHSLMYNSV